MIGQARRRKHGETKPKTMNTRCGMALEREMATYQANLMEMLADEGKFVVIRDEEVLGAWPTYDEALGAGYEKYGLEPFLVKQIRRVEPIHYFSRDLPRCQP